MCRYLVARPLGGVSKATSKRGCVGRERDHGAGGVWPRREAGREAGSDMERGDLSLLQWRGRRAKGSMSD
jgi:hypothetical protein